MNQLEEIGFLKITNIPGFDEVEIYYWTKWLFSLPDDQKEKLLRRPYNKNSKNIYRGLIPFLKDDPSHKEIFDFGRNFDKLSFKEKNAPI